MKNGSLTAVFLKPVFPPGPFPEFGTCLFKAAVAFADRKHAADSVAAVQRIGCEIKMYAVGAAVIELSVQRIHFKSHKAGAVKVGGHNAFFAA